MLFSLGYTRNTGAENWSILGTGQALSGRQTPVVDEYILDNDTAGIPLLIEQIEDSICRLGVYDPAGLKLIGIALHEALTNAVLHGNLELSSALRESDEAEFYRLSIARRDELPYRDRLVTVTVRYSRDEVTFTIRDEGKGFDPALLRDPTDLDNLGKPSGRGLLLIRSFMDRVHHNTAGNEITLVKRRVSGPR